MSWFKKKDSTAIPPVNEQAHFEVPGSGPSRHGDSGPTSRVSNSRTYVASRDGDPYARPSPARNNSDGLESGGLPSAPGRDRYNRNKPVGDAYSRGRADIDQDRAALFAGYDPEKHKPTGRFTDGPSRGFEENGITGDGEEEDEVEGIKKQTRFTKQESVNSTRNALRIAREAEETARNTLGRLGDQSEKLANTDRHLGMSKVHVENVADKQDELKQLNRSIFRPVIVFDKKAKRAAQEEKLVRRHEEERDEREKAMSDIRDTQDRIGKAQTYGRGWDDDDDEAIGGYGSGKFKPPADQAKRKEERKQYQFEATASDDELEDELDDNLGEVSEVTKRLKALGVAMGDELDKQNKRIDQLDGKVGKLDRKLFDGTRRFERIK